MRAKIFEQLIVLMQPERGAKRWMKCKKFVNYFVATNTYSKSPHTGPIAAPFDFTSALKNMNGEKWVLAGSEKVGGKDCFVLKISAKPSANSGGGTTRIYIDKSNYHFRQVKTEVKMNSPKGPITMTSAVAVRSEKFDAPVKDSIFTFKPPTGAKLEQPTPR